MNPAYQNIDAKSAGIPEDLEVRHYPETIKQFLAFQIGYTTTRREMQPLYGEDNRVKGEKETGKTTPVFVLKAWGESLKSAKEMLFLNASKNGEAQQ